MQDCLGSWIIRVTGFSITAGTAKTAVQYQASASNTAEVLYFSISQSGSTTSNMENVKLLRKTAAATVTAGVEGTNFFDFAGGQGTFAGTLSTTGTGVNATAEGTDGNLLKNMNFNTLAGYEWNAQPNMRFWVPVSGIIAVKVGAIVTGTWDVELVIAEAK